MATMYDPGYGGDGSANYYGQTASNEEERRRREAQQQLQRQQLQQQQNQLQQASQQAQQGYQGEPGVQTREQAGQSSTQAQPSQRYNQPQQTFAQLQQAGQARPAPPPAPSQPQSQPQSQQMQRMPAGTDMNAVAADPQGYQRWLAQAQAQEAARPGSTMLGNGAPSGAPGGTPTGQGVLFNGPMVNTRLDQRLPGAPPQFSGDIPEYLQQMMNAQGPQVNLPTVQDTSALARQVAQLGGMQLPQAPQYQMDPNLLRQAQQLTQGGRIGGQAATGGVSAAGVDPMAAASVPSGNPAQAFQENTELGSAWNGRGAGQTRFGSYDAQGRGMGNPMQVNFDELRSQGYTIARQQDGSVVAYEPGQNAGAAGSSGLTYNADGTRAAPPGMEWTPDGVNLVPRGAGASPQGVSGAGVDPLAAAQPRTDQYGAERGAWFRDAVRAAGVPELSDVQRQGLQRQNSALQVALMNAAAQEGSGGKIGGQQGVMAALDNFTKVNAPDRFVDPVTGGVTSDMTRANLRQNAFLSSLLSGASAEEAQATAMQAAGVPAGLETMGLETMGRSSPAGAGQGGNQAFDSELDRQMMAALQNPSAFDNPEVKRLYEQMGQGIDDQFAQEETRLREEMAGRGLSDSSIQGGRLADLNVGRRSARTELANQLATQRAQDFAQSRNAALGLGLQSRNAALQAELGRGNLALEGELGRGNLSLGQQRAGVEAELGRGNLDVNRQQAATAAELGRGNLQLGQQRNAVDAELGRGNLGIAQGRLGLDQQGQQFGQQMQGLQFQNQLGQQNFQNQLSSADFGLRSSGQQFNQGLAGAQFQNQLGQQGFTNQMTLADFQRGLGNDAYTRQNTYLDRLIGIGQDSFNNDLRREQLNQQISDSDWNKWLQLQNLYRGG